MRFGEDNKEVNIYLTPFIIKRINFKNYLAPWHSELWAAIYDKIYAKEIIGVGPVAQW